MGFVANFLRFPAVQKIENRLRFDKVTDSLKMGTFQDIRALWRSGLSAKEPECQKLKNGGLDQYGPGRSEV